MKPTDCPERIWLFDEPAVPAAPVEWTDEPEQCDGDTVEYIRADLALTMEEALLCMFAACIICREPFSIPAGDAISEARHEADLDKELCNGLTKDEFSTIIARVIADRAGNADEGTAKETDA